MSLALVGIIAVLLVFNFWRERQYDRLTDERERAWRLERTALLQRIQAPERAVAEHHTSERVPAPPPIAPDDDEAWVALKQQRMNGGDAN